MEKDLTDLLSKQHLISSYIGEKLEIVNYIKEGYDDNLPILINNKFLHFSAHLYYRSIIVDLYALYGVYSDNNKYSLHKIKQRNYSAFIQPSAITFLSDTLKSLKHQITVIKDLRHREIAHYDFEDKVSISHNFYHLPILNNLHQKTIDILKLISSSYIQPDSGVDFDFGRKSHTLVTLEKLIEKATGK